MDQQIIKTLLQKYYDGSTSLEEEDLLIEYFLDNDVPQEFAADKEQILGMSVVRDTEISIPTDLENNILESLKSVQEVNKVRSLRSRPIYMAMSVAASVLIIVSAVMFINRQPDLGSFDDPDLAYVETREALDMMSKYFAKGTTHLSDLNIMEEAVKPLNSLNKVETPRKSIQYLKAFDQGISKAQGLIDLNKQKEQ